MENNDHDQDSEEGGKGTVAFQESRQKPSPELSVREIAAEGWQSAFIEDENPRNVVVTFETAELAAEFVRALKQ